MHLLNPPLFFQLDDLHHFRKPANDITSQLEINFGDLGRPSRGRGGPRGGRGGRGRGSFVAEATRPVRGGRTDKVDSFHPFSFLRTCFQMFDISNMYFMFTFLSPLRLCPMWTTQRLSQPWVKPQLLPPQAYRSLRSTSTMRLACSWILQQSEMMEKSVYGTQFKD